MNFIKKSIFRRNNEQTEQEQSAENGGILAVWGSPGSGKTVTAVKLAKALADQKKNVALLLCDMTAPMLCCICPPSELECEQSLGSVLAVPRISDALIKNHIITHKRMSHLTFLGMKKG
ncbi:MAG: ParA family protein, partial [Oscillospiraceae bacterium]